MNERKQKKSEAATSGPLGGERLAAARRANEISARDIAKELHLDEPKVRALEQNNFDVLGAPVFAKGHLRKYAELVGVSIDDILADYYQLNRSAGAPPVVGPKRKIRRDLALGPWIGGTVAVIVLAAAAYWWFTRDPAAQTEPATLAPFASDANAEPAQDDATTSSNVEAEPAIVAPTQESLSQETIVMLSGPRGSESESAFDQASLLPQVRIELFFSGDCWTEISDASGRRLFYDLGTAGRVVSLSGAEPIRIVLGDSRNVSVVVDGRVYPIPGSARSGRLARLTVNSQ